MKDKFIVYGISADKKVFLTTNKNFETDANKDVCKVHLNTNDFTEALNLYSNMKDVQDWSGQILLDKDDDWDSPEQDAIRQAARDAKAAKLEEEAKNKESKR